VSFALPRCIASTFFRSTISNSQDKQSRSRDAVASESSARSVTARHERRLLPPAKGRRSAERRILSRVRIVRIVLRHLAQVVRRAARAFCKARSPFGAPRRPCAGAFTPTRPGPRFLESPDANGRTLSGASAAGTLQSEHAPDGTMPRPPEGRNDDLLLQEPHPLRQSASPVDVPHEERDFLRRKRAHRECQIIWLPRTVVPINRGFVHDAWWHISGPRGAHPAFCRRFATPAEVRMSKARCKTACSPD
jgi:hypothetical protein